MFSFKMGNSQRHQWVWASAGALASVSLLGSGMLTGCGGGGDSGGTPTVAPNPNPTNFSYGIRSGEWSSRSAGTSGSITLDISSDGSVEGEITQSAPYAFALIHGVYQNGQLRIRLDPSSHQAASVPVPTITQLAFSVDFTSGGPSPSPGPVEEAVFDAVYPFSGTISAVGTELNGELTR